jgi:hypothetical protein
MARYRIGYGNTRILVPFDSTRTVADLRTEVVRRLQQRVGPLAEDGVELLLGDPNGVSLDPADRLDDVILDDDNDWIFVSRRDGHASGSHEPLVSQPPDVAPQVGESRFLPLGVKFYDLH